MKDILIYMYHGTVGKKNAKKEIPFREVFKTVSTFCGKINYVSMVTFIVILEDVSFLKFLMQESK